MSSGNMCPERKKLNSMYTNSSELTSRNQKPIMPMVASRKNPSRKPIMSEAEKATKHGRWPTGEVIAAEEEDQREWSDRHRVVDQLVGHPVQEQKAHQVDRLDQVLLISPSRICGQCLTPGPACSKVE